ADPVRPDGGRPRGVPPDEDGLQLRFARRPVRDGLGPRGRRRPNDLSRHHPPSPPAGARPMIVVVLAALAAGPAFAPPTDRKIDFGRDVVPVLTRHGCNAGGCHGKASGQNGFKLSLLGFDPAFDHDAIVNEARGRRLFPASPENSLLLTKG